MTVCGRPALSLYMRRAQGRPPRTAAPHTIPNSSREATRAEKAELERQPLVAPAGGINLKSEPDLRLFVLTVRLRRA
jgi:hypothetical protein